MDDVTITEAKPEHLDAVLTLARQTTETHEAAGPPHYNKLGTEARYDTYRNHFAPQTGPTKTRLWVLLRGQDVLGYVLVTLTTATYESGVQDVAATIFDITLTEAVRGKGLGRRAMEHVTAHLRDTGVSLIRAQTWWGNHASDGLFRGQSFNRVVTVYETRLAEAQPQPNQPKPWSSTRAKLQGLILLLALLAYLALEVWTAWRH